MAEFDRCLSQVCLNKLPVPITLLTRFSHAGRRLIIVVARPKRGTNAWNLAHRSSNSGSHRRFPSLGLQPRCGLLALWWLGACPRYRRDSRNTRTHLESNTACVFASGPEGFSVSILSVGDPTS